MPRAWSPVPLVIVASVLALTGCGTSVSGGGSGGETGQGGTGGGGTGGSGANTGAGGGGGPLDCGDFVRCATDLGDDAGRCSGGGSCAFVPGCVTAICIDEGEACAATCLDSECYILESFPTQITCEGTVTDAIDDVTCDEVRAELAEIQRCTADEECGLVLEGTSCGCTRDLVARLDAPEDIFQALREAAPDCAFGSTCDCPETDGFECLEGVCSWRYVL